MPKILKLNSALETYEKQEEILYILSNENLTKRPSKLYKLIIYYLHSEDIIHMFENDTIYNNHNEVVNFLTYQCCAGRMNELYYHLIENY